MLVVGAETKKTVVKGEALRFLPKIIHINCGYERAPNTAHVFESGITLLAVSSSNLAVPNAAMYSAGEIS